MIVVTAKPRDLPGPGDFAETTGIYGNYGDHTDPAFLPCWSCGGEEAYLDRDNEDGPVARCRECHEEMICV